jgi:hypothetical protein
MFQIAVGLLIVFGGIFITTEGIREQCDIKNYVLKLDVKNAFKDMNWSKEVFRVGDVTIKDNKGHDTFYASEEIDKAINKLNEKLERSE